MMTSTLGRLAVLLVGATMAVALAQAQQPAQGSKSTTPAATSQPARKADSKTSAAQPVKTAAAQKADDDAQLIKDARNAGFKPETIRGTLMFCRTARELGSNFPVRTCYDSDQVKIKIHEYQTERNEMESQHNTGMFTH